MFCLPQQFAEKIKKALKDGIVNPEKLNKMTSSERRGFLSGIIGEENAKQINLLFEQKLLLKNQEKAIYDWARDITGLSETDKNSTLEKIRKTYADKKRRLYEPKENEKFLNELTSDIYSKKYKTEISLNEAQEITELTADTNKAKSKMNEDFTFPTKEDGLNFGASKVALNNYIGALKTEANKRTFINPLKEENKIEVIIENAKISVNLIAENARSIVASIDNSFWGRQGIKVMFRPTTFKIWAKNFAKSFNDIYQILKNGTKQGDAILDGVKSDIYSRKNYLNGNYERGKKLDIGIREEEFPTSLPSKIPVLGRFFKAAEVAYEAGAMRLRVDVADKIYSMAEKSGIDLKNEVEIGEINRMVNTMTGRGELPISQGKQAFLNKAFFSVKFFKSNLDTLLDPLKSKSSFVRKQSSINLLSIIAGVGTILAISKTLYPNSIELNSNSSDFGKIKIGNTRIDVTGGLASLVILTSRIFNQTTKSSVTDVVLKFGEGYGSQTGMDAIWNFTENKFSPLFSVIKDLIEQQTFEGDKPTIFNEAKNLTTPLIVSTGIDAAKENKKAMILLAVIADGLGFSINTYGYSDNWSQNTGKELQQFKTKVGESRFNEANDKYNKMVNDWLSQNINSEKYKKLSDEDKKSLLTDKKKEFKNRIFKQYGFTYKK